MRASSAALRAASSASSRRGRLLSLAAHESPRVRRRLAWSLGSFGPEETTPTFERLLNDDDDAVREAAIENALRSLGPRRARESVAANAPGLLREFVEALQYFQDSATAEVLEALASHEDPKVAEAATLALQDEESG